VSEGALGKLENNAHRVFSGQWSTPTTDGMPYATNGDGDDRILSLQIFLIVCSAPPQARTRGRSFVVVRLVSRPPHRFLAAAERSRGIEIAA